MKKRAQGAGLDPKLHARIIMDSLKQRIQGQAVRIEQLEMLLKAAISEGFNGHTTFNADVLDDCKGTELLMQVTMEPKKAWRARKKKDPETDRKVEAVTLVLADPEEAKEAAAKRHDLDD